MNKPSFLLELKDISKIYITDQGELPILSQVTLQIPRGSFTAIVGPSGAGKSTLLHLMGLLDQPDQGTLHMDGRAIHTLSDTQKSKLRCERIGFIFQSYHLLPELSALENIMLPAQTRGATRSVARKKAMELLERVNLQSRAHHHPGTLSGGEQQRACICRALVNGPELILADEPTGNLDSHNALEVEKLLEEMTSRYNAALVMVTHNETLANRAHNKVALLDGKILDSQGLSCMK